MTEAQREQRLYALAISGGVCEVCGKMLIDGQPQGAHRIGNTQGNRRARTGSGTRRPTARSMATW